MAASAPALSVGRYHDAVLAAQQGHGIALVWNVSDGKDLSIEGLVPAIGPEIRSPGAFYLVPLTTDKEETRSVIDWFKGQSVTENNAGA